MQIYQHMQPFEPSLGQNGCAIALGFFDGIHTGHRAVIQTAVDWACEHKAAPALFTFALPNKNALKGARLCSVESKHQMIASLGISHYFVPDFNEIKQLTPLQFVEVLVTTLGARAIVCGENFTFGAKAAGNVALLKQLCAARGVQVFALPMALYQDKAVSSTRIRDALVAGDMPAARAMLGEPYSINFPVQHGQGLGSKLAVPTINQHYPAGFQQPKQGIYITRVLLDGVWYPSATGIGSRPTVNQDESLVTCETFIPGFSGDLYGATPRVEFYSYLQEIQRFNTLQELKTCITNAAEQAIAYFEPKTQV